MILWKEGVWMDTFLMMFSVRELIIAAAVLVVIIIALIISRIVSTRNMQPISSVAIRTGCRPLSRRLTGKTSCRI